jgi:hypothetical protein
VLDDADGARMLSQRQYLKNIDTLLKPCAPAINSCKAKPTGTVSECTGAFSSRRKEKDKYKSCLETERRKAKGVTPIILNIPDRPYCFPHYILIFFA